ncbi:cysteine-rich motor neuron 1 protein-like [Haliotis asinina]|uniref:cysteine-rich motor neuron 1 protein-like n=1 Tax=Haliotis asinina TaxID=109174 RepID=UPI003531CEE9
MWQLLVASLVATVVIVESAGVCPTTDPRIPWACGHFNKCFGDATCGAGQKCCPHICGDHCVTVVHCDPIDCGSLKCNYGFQPDSRGCKTCTCRTCTLQICSVF